MLYRVLLYNEYFNKAVLCNSKAQLEKTIKESKKVGFTDYRILNHARKKKE